MNSDLTTLIISTIGTILGCLYHWYFYQLSKKDEFMIVFMIYPGGVIIIFPMMMIFSLINILK